MPEAIFHSCDVIAAARRPRGFDAAARGLWCRGDLGGLTLTCVAIVGTRAATPYGRRLAHNFAAELGRSGCCIVSGLALGIDGAAHEGAVSVGAPTIGVLGSGHHHFFPRRNRGLAERMLDAGGAVLSPYPPEQPAYPSQFLQRNGVVAALADAVVVIEAPARSGALNTAGWAAGRIPVLAVPGDVDRPHVQGCLALIRDGATLARGASDVLESLGLPGAVRVPREKLPIPSDPVAAAVLSAIEGAATSLDDIVLASGLSASAALAALTRLEIEGAVDSRGGTLYARVGGPPSGEDAPP